MMDIQKLQEESQRFKSLMDSPEPGLFTWHGFLKERVDNIIRWYYGEAALEAIQRTIR